MAEIRAAQLKEDLRALADLGGEAERRVLAALAPELLQRIAHATRVDWLPAELNVELARVGQRVLGDMLLQRWGKASVLRSMRSSLLGPILHGAIGVFGLSPAAIFRTVPAAFRAAFRGCGEMSVSGGDEPVRRVALRGLPPELRDRAFLIALAGSLEGIFDVCRLQGEARLVSEPASEVEFVATWRPPATRSAGAAAGAGHEAEAPPPVPRRPPPER